MTGGPAATAAILAFALASALLGDMLLVVGGADPRLRPAAPSLSD
jgi:hypothetical protein